MKIGLGAAKAIPRVLWGESASPILLQPVIDVMARYAFLSEGFSAQDVFVPASR